MAQRYPTRFRLSPAPLLDGFAPEEAAQADVITHPSGLSGRVSGIKVPEERVLVYCKLAKSAGRSTTAPLVLERGPRPGAGRLRRGQVPHPG